jgi:hypothetical protein
MFALAPGPIVMRRISQTHCQPDSNTGEDKRQKGKSMLVKLSTDKTVSETAAALQAAVQANHVGVMQVHNLKETMTKEGVAFAQLAVSGHHAAGLCAADPGGEDLGYSQVWRVIEVPQSMRSLRK